MSTTGQGHSLTLVQVTYSIFSYFFSSITARPIEAQFHVAFPWDGEMEAISNDLGHLTKMATMPIYGKTFKNLILWSQRLMTLKLGTQRLVLKYYQICPTDDLGLTLTYFYSKVKFGPFCLCMGKPLKL